MPASAKTNTAKTTKNAENAVKRPTKSPLRAIRRKCLECSGDSALEVKECVMDHCALWPFRFGRNPYDAKSLFQEPEEEALPELLAEHRQDSAAQALAGQGHEALAQSVKADPCPLATETESQITREISDSSPAKPCQPQSAASAASPSPASAAEPSFPPNATLQAETPLAAEPPKSAETKPSTTPPAPWPKTEQKKPSTKKIRKPATSLLDFC
ncbi:MAG: hypothetical protein K6G15_11460 [Desulfovibrio sp.]|nr:hypothetical protein [Desulfovibrio sp.]